MRTLIFLVMFFPAYVYASWDFFGHQEAISTAPAEVITISETNDDCKNGVCPIPKIVNKVAEVPNILHDRVTVPAKEVTKNCGQKIRRVIKKPFRGIFQRKYFRWR